MSITKKPERVTVSGMDLIEALADGLQRKIGKRIDLASMRVQIVQALLNPNVQSNGYDIIPVPVSIGAPPAYEIALEVEADIVGSLTGPKLRPDIEVLLDDAKRQASKQ